MRNLLLAATALLVLPPSIACTAAGPGASPRTSNPDVVRGKAGPFAAATVTIARSGDAAAGGFSAALDTGTGRHFPLPGPDDPADFFIVEPTAVMFAPVDTSGRNAVIILYTSSQIGPGHGTDHKALVYRVAADGITRVPGAEARLEGAPDAKTVRARLRSRS